MMERPRLSKIMEMFLFLLIGAVVLFPPRGCPKGDLSVSTSMVQDHKASSNSLKPETIYFLEAGQVKAWSVGSKAAHEIFTAKGTVDSRTYFNVYPKTSKFIYAATNADGEQEIRELPMKGRDTLIDKAILNIYPAGMKGSVFYTKGDGTRNNKLYYYEDSSPPRYLKIDNIEGLIYNDSDISEICYSGFSPDEGLCRIYVGRIDSAKKDLIAELHTSNWCRPVKLTNDLIIYTVSSPHYEDDLTVYAFSRKTKQTFLLANNAALLDVAHTKDMILVALQTPSNASHCLEIWRVDGKAGSSQQLIGIKNTRVTEARFTPEADGIVFVQDSYRKLCFYDFNNRHTRDLVCVPGDAIKEFSFGEDGKTLFFVVEEYSNAIARKSQSIYRVQLTTGKQSLVYRPDKPKHSTSLHIIEPSKSELCVGEH